MEGAASHIVNVAPLDIRRVYILPTRHGLLLLGLLIIILLGATNYDNALAYLLCFLLGGVFLVGMIHTYHNLAGLALQAVQVDPVYAGSPAVFALTLTDDVSRPRVQLRLAHHPRRRRGEPRATTVAAATFDLHESPAVVALSLPTTQRGQLPLERVEISSAFPLGLLRAWAYFDTRAAGIVYPRAAGQLPLPFNAAAHAEHVHGTLSGLDDFADLARYRSGDSLGAIHWPIYARNAELMVKRFHSGAGELDLNWDATRTLGEDETRLAQLAQWILNAERLRVPYALTLRDRIIPASVGALQLARAMTALALFE